MIDITIGISPIEREYPTGISIEKWVGDIGIKGGEDDSVLHWHIESESPRHIVETQICALESMKDAIEKRIKLLESSIRDKKEMVMEENEKKLIGFESKELEEILASLILEGWL